MRGKRDESKLKKYDYKFGFNDQVNEICVIVSSKDGSTITPKEYVWLMQSWADKMQDKCHEIFKGSPVNEQDPDLN